jgi:hypothetical protein
MNINNIDDKLKDLYIRSISDYIYSLCYSKNLKIDFDKLQDFFSKLVDGVCIGNNKFGGIYKIYFYDSMTKMNELIKEFFINNPEIIENKYQLIIFAPKNKSNTQQFVGNPVNSPNNITSDRKLCCELNKAKSNAGIVVSYNNSIIYQKSPQINVYDDYSQDSSSQNSESYASTNSNNSGNSINLQSDSDTNKIFNENENENKNENENENENSEPHSNFYINSILYGYQLYKYFRDKKISNLPKYITSISQLNSMKIKKKDKFGFFVFDDYSNSGKNLLDRILNLKKILPKNALVYFFYSYVSTDTIYTILHNKDQIPDNFKISFYSLIYNFPIFRFNYLKQNNSRFFCINNYYTVIFNFLDQNFNHIFIYKPEKYINTYSWYLYCKALSEIMDDIHIEVQRYICKFFESQNNIFKYSKFEFFTPSTHIYTDYNKINNNNERNIFLTGKIHKRLTIQYIVY